MPLSIFKALKKLSNINAEMIDNKAIIKINKMKENGLLKNNRPKKMKHPSSDFMDYYLSHKLANITLQVTQYCNFRCEYCVYGQDSTLNRSHTSNRMTYDIAKQSLDFLLNRSRDSESVNIGFYDYPD